MSNLCGRFEALTSARATARCEPRNIMEQIYVGRILSTQFAGRCGELRSWCHPPPASGVAAMEPATTADPVLAPHLRCWK